MSVPEFAPAKVNLALHITGQRADGYHLLDSIVGFASIGDKLTVSEAATYQLTATGAFVEAMPKVEDNLITKAVNWFAANCSENPNVAISLEKNLPAAAGIGGASADAAAVIRALAKLWDKPLPTAQDLLFLGADVPMCLASTSCRVGGIGEELIGVASLSGTPIVLVNPRVAVPTPKVFGALKSRNNPAITNPDFTAETDVIEWVLAQRNDMQDAAKVIAPAINDVLMALESTFPRIARMSGSGATCFGIYGTQDAANEAAQKVATINPNWWVTCGQLI
ncbi:Putative 4-diphosphocytidyl-2C-methyl-D-erythritol kinase [Rhodobacterales bacterium HTCC2150]|nr:Putative 4-diphosphocytidyl-2C-methyl-D-erythritol kinase [Rhodobacterales bacterium HTCC2150] [Rhodobacteraceae bacterium HTCC2150]